MAKFSVQLLQKVICPTTYVLEDSVPKGNSYLDVFLFPIFPLFSPFFLSFYYFFLMFISLGKGNESLSSFGGN